ncbi:hypothetical protein D3C72_1332690 [compost metagenome]
MDKFNRRPNSRTRKRQVLLVLLAFGLCAGCFGALIAFGNTGGLWVLGIYACGLVILGISQWRAVARNHRLWLAGLNTQSHQGPGFSTLETAAISHLFAKAGSNERGLRQHFSASEVIARYNSGVGSVTTFRSDRPCPVSAPVLDVTSWFQVEGLASVVGCRFWADDDGLLTTLEFFTGGEDTSWLEWATVSFDYAAEDAPRPNAPQTRPVASEPRWVHYRPEI